MLQAIVSELDHCHLSIFQYHTRQRSFMAAGSLTLGGNMSLALGPLGRNGEASGALNTNGKVAAM